MRHLQRRAARQAPSADHFDADAGEPALAAAAVSARHTVVVAVNDDGYVARVRLLDDSVRGWDTDTLAQRIAAVAAVAHDRYLAVQDTAIAHFPTVQEVADAESALAF